jgi:uncharacterized MAPEG superfamily protein
MEANLAWKAFSICLVLLFAKGLATSIYQARLRIKANAFVSPEDARLMRSRCINAESAQIQRVGAVWRNDLENIPYFLVLALTYVLLGCWPAGAPLYFGLFVLFRFSHTAAYLRRLQPLRFICYSGAVVISCILSGHIIYSIFII